MMSNKKLGRQTTYFLNIEPDRKIQRMTHAMMPLHLYEHLFRTACELALNDSEIAQWVFDELEILDRIRETGLYHGARMRQEFKKYKGLPCVVCGEPSNSVDHIIPLSRGGTNDPSNLQPMCQLCNSKKGAKINSEKL